MITTFDPLTAGIVGAGSTIALIMGLLAFVFSIPTAIFGFFF